MRSTLDNISPIDGRYQETTKKLAALTSERALMSYRVQVEIAWLETLSNAPEIDCPDIKAQAQKTLSRLKRAISNEDIKRIKEIEEKTRHDVKAVEYFLSEQLNQSAAPELTPWIHFACTSEDINNTAYSLMLKKTRDEVLIPELLSLCAKLAHIAKLEAGTPMLAWTHGQTASPTTFGKEIAVFLHRISPRLEAILRYNFSAKLNGAVGNFNAHMAAYPNTNWQELAKKTVHNLGLEHNTMSTQISNHDNLVQFLSLYRQIMLVLQDLSQDLWLYAAKGYLRLSKDTITQVGSSTMPHKINPIHFENAEGNIGMHKAISGQLIDKLPISRLQRDLSDSTTLRNLGLSFAYAQVAVNSLNKGVESISTNKELMLSELNKHWEVMTEAVQTILRKHGHYNAYEELKKASQGTRISKTEFEEIIKTLNIKHEIKQELLRLEPKSYLGSAKEQALSISSSFNIIFNEQRKQTRNN